MAEQTTTREENSRHLKPGSNPATQQAPNRKKLRQAEIRREAQLLIKDGVPQKEGCQILRERFDCTYQFAHCNWREVAKRMKDGGPKPPPTDPEEIMLQILAGLWRAFRIAEGQNDPGKMCQALKLISEHTVKQKKPVGRPPKKNAAEIPAPENAATDRDVQKALQDAKAAGLDVSESEVPLNGQAEGNGEQPE